MRNIQRFTQAQRGSADFPSYTKAHAEIAAGKKRTHWMWYIFPQLAALGRSQTAKYFGIVGFEEACEYLSDVALFGNYQEIASLVLKQLKTRSAKDLFGADAVKLVSSLTLFQAAASYLSQGNQSSKFAQLAKCCDDIFSELRKKGYTPCKETRALIESSLSTGVQQRVDVDIEVEEEQPPVKSHEVEQSQDLSVLSKALDAYIKEREDEWSFHYNFLGIVSLIYWLLDRVAGTDYFNFKSKDIKISAARELKDMIDNQDLDFGQTSI